jgi:hypothetical protein
LVLFGCGAVIGLGVAGYALFTAKGTSTLFVPPEDAALVNQQPIARSDVTAQLRTLYDVTPEQATAAQKKTALDDLIREELFVQRARELDVASVDPDVRQAMVSAVEQQVAADAITSSPSAAKLQAYFDAHRANYATEGEIEVLDLVFPAEAPAAAAAAALRNGADVARYAGQDSHRTRGAEFYFAAKIHLGPTLFAAAAPLSDRGVAGPLPQPDGVHVLYVVKNLKPRPLSYEQSAAQVLSDYRQAAIKRLQTGDEAFLRKRATILIARDLR